MYSSWPHAGSVECKDEEDGGFSGCKYAGLFSNIPAGNKPNCAPGAKLLSRPNSNRDVQCRWPKAKVRSWNVAATWQDRPDLLNRKVWVMLAGGKILGEFNVRDVCSDNDCDGCCSQNTGGGTYPLIDMEVSGYCKGMGCNPDTVDLNNLPHAPNTRPV